MLLLKRALAVFHTGYIADPLFTQGRLLGREDYVDITHMRPAAVDRVARAFPDLKILMAHFGNPWWEEAWKVMASHAHVYADFSGGTAKTRSMSMWREMFAPDGRLDSKAVGKLCFACDGSPFSTATDSYTAIIEFYERFYDALHLSAEQHHRIDRGNILALIGK